MKRSAVTARAAPPGVLFVCIPTQPALANSLYGMPRFHVGPLGFVQHAMEEMGKKPTADELEAFMKEVDLDGNGTVGNLPCM